MCGSVRTRRDTGANVGRMLAGCWPEARTRQGGRTSADAAKAGARRSRRRRFSRYAYGVATFPAAGRPVAVSAPKQALTFLAGRGDVFNAIDLYAAAASRTDWAKRSADAHEQAIALDSSFTPAVRERLFIALLARDRDAIMKFATLLGDNTATRSLSL